MKKKEIEELAESHWEYVESVIRIEHEGDEKGLDEYCKRVGHHFKTAMIHGVKHGVEWAQLQYKNKGR